MRTMSNALFDKYWAKFFKNQIQCAQAEQNPLVLPLLGLSATKSLHILPKIKPQLLFLTFLTLEMMFESSNRRV